MVYETHADLWWCSNAQHTKGNSVKFQPGAGPSVPQQCPHTGSGFLMGGPFWVEPLHDPAWIAALLASVKVRTCCTVHTFLHLVQPRSAQGMVNQMLSYFMWCPLAGAVVPRRCSTAPCMCGQHCCIPSEAALFPGAGSMQMQAGARCSEQCAAGKECSTSDNPGYPLHSQEHKAGLGAFERVRGVLAAAGEELHDCPLYLDLHAVCASLKCTPMKHDVFRSALLNAGRSPCLLPGTCLHGTFLRLRSCCCPGKVISVPKSLEPELHQLAVWSHDEPCSEPICAARWFLTWSCR